MVELFANSGDPDQTPRSMASDLGLHCLPITLKVVYRLQWIKSSDENYRHFFLFFMFLLKTRKYITCWLFLFIINRLKLKPDMFCITKRVMTAEP